MGLVKSGGAVNRLHDGDSLKHRASFMIEHHFGTNVCLALAVSRSQCVSPRTGVDLLLSFRQRVRSGTKQLIANIVLFFVPLLPQHWQVWSQNSYHLSICHARLAGTVSAS